MATQTLEFNATTGLAISCKLFALESDTVVATVAATEKTNDKGRYSVAFTDVAAGAYRLNGFVGAVGGFANEVYDLTLETDVFIPRAEIGLGNVPTVTEISDRIERAGGPLDSLETSALTGPFTFTPTVQDANTSEPIQGAQVRVSRTGESQSKRTSANGSMTPFSLGNFFWTITTTAQGYAGDTRTLNISDDTTLTIELSPVAISNPPNVTDCRLSAFVFLGSTPVQGATVTAKLRRNNQATEGIVQSVIPIEATTNAQGLATLDLVQGGQFVDGDGVYKIEAKHNNKLIWSIESAMPDQAQVNLEDLLTPP